MESPPTLKCGHSPHVLPSGHCPSHAAHSSWAMPPQSHVLSYHLWGIPNLSLALTSPPNFRFLHLREVAQSESRSLPPSPQHPAQHLKKECTWGACSLLELNMPQSELTAFPPNLLLLNFLIFLSLQSCCHITLIRPPQATVNHQGITSPTTTKRSQTLHIRVYLRCSKWCPDSY